MRFLSVFVAVLALTGSLLALTDDDVTAILNSLVAADANRATTSQVVLDYQDMASHTHFDHDNAKNPLFKSVDAALLNRDTYSGVRILSELYTADASLDDPNGAQRDAAFQQFFYAMNQTAVFRQGWQFLIDQKLASNDFTAFRNAIYQLWFTVFARKTNAGSSGFEAVFAGEFLDTDVIGLSNWLRFYILEQRGTVDYHGWFERQKDIQLSLQFGFTASGNVKQALVSPLLLDSSPEFDIMAYTICSLAGNNKCTYSVDGNNIALTVVTRSVNGATVIDNAFPAIAGGGSNPPAAGTTKKPSGDATALQKLVDDMRAADTDKAPYSSYKLDWGSHLGGGGGSPSGKKLFTSVDESTFSKKVYADLSNVLDNNLLNPDVCVNETDYNAGFKKAAFTQLLNTWADTDVFKLMHTYLVNAGKADANVSNFKSYLYKFWYGSYSRCTSNKKILGSSGFEHVFSGEWKSGEVDGQHNWMRYYKLEKAGDISYYGYYHNDGQLTGTFEYKWKTEMKKEGGFLIGTSPVFDFSLFTTCALTESGAKKCRFTIDNYQLAVTAYVQDCAGGGTCLATSYPVDEL